MQSRYNLVAISCCNVAIGICQCECIISHQRIPLWDCCVSDVAYILCSFIETWICLFWRNCRRWLHSNLSKWHLSVQPVTKIPSQWRLFCFSVPKATQVPLSHWSCDKMVASLHTTFSNTLSWMKSFAFEFHLPNTNRQTCFQIMAWCTIRPY